METVDNMQGLGTFFSDNFQIRFPLLAPVENVSIFAGFDDGTEQGSGHPRTLPRLPTGAGLLLAHSV